MLVAESKIATSLNLGKEDYYYMLTVYFAFVRSFFFYFY